jgi:predicted phage tail protein
MREIRLYGALGAEFGPSHRFHIDSVQEGIQALAANFPGFLNNLRHGFYQIIVGESRESGLEMDERDVVAQRLSDAPVHIIPVTEGSRRGLGKIIAGIALIGLSMITGGTALAALMATPIGATTVGATVASIGTGLILTGVASLIAPEQKASEQQQSFTMAGPQVTLKEGGIVPIVYGEVVTGGTMISGILKVENDAQATGASAPVTPTQPVTPTEPIQPGEPGEF